MNYINYFVYDSLFLSSFIICSMVAPMPMSIFDLNHNNKPFPFYYQVSDFYGYDGVLWLFGWLLPTWMFYHGL